MTLHNNTTVQLVVCIIPLSSCFSLLLCTAPFAPLLGGQIIDVSSYLPGKIWCMIAREHDIDIDDFFLLTLGYM